MMSINNALQAVDLTYVILSYHLQHKSELYLKCCSNLVYVLSSTMKIHMYHSNLLPILNDTTKLSVHVQNQGNTINQEIIVGIISLLEL